MEKSKKFLAFIESFEGEAPEGLIESIREGFLVMVEGEDMDDGSGADDTAQEVVEDSGEGGDDTVADSVGADAGTDMEPPAELDAEPMLEEVEVNPEREALLNKVYKKLVRMLLSNIVSREEVEKYVENQYPELASKFSWKADTRRQNLDTGGPAWVVESGEEVVNTLVEGYIRDVVMKKGLTEVEE